MKTIARTTFDDMAITIDVDHYNTHPHKLAVVAFIPEEGEIYDQLSINLDAEPHSDNAFFISDETWSHRLIDQLVKESIIRPTGNATRYGNFQASATEYEILI